MTAAKKLKLNNKYSKFKKLDGSHPLKKSCPDSYILYKTRKREGGKLAFFNFELAREMGLIEGSHQDKINKKLEKQILDTFSFTIINEFDIENNKFFSRSELRDGEYMATRYLQLQHPTKKGETSGDGRSVWCGQLKNNGRTWDVSSAGTGATSLSPATHIYNKNFETGDPSISYGCGYAEIDEGLATLFFSEILKTRYSTERVLAIIDYGNGISINVRAHECLIRPSHMFNWLKQKNYEALENIVNYYIDQQVSNKNWKDCPKSKNARYRYFLKKQNELFANLVADFEDDYIFCWLDWDGDNVLMDGGIIDYGSIRQFGLFHHEYRFDDVEQYSTNIKEQKEKAKLIVKSFEQIVEFLITRESPTMTSLKESETQKKFDQIFKKRKVYNLLKRIGFNEMESVFLYKNHLEKITKFSKTFSYFERAKSLEGPINVNDGISWNAIFCLRDVLRELPQVLHIRDGEILKHSDFIDIIKSRYATKEDLQKTTLSKKSREFQKNYLSLVSTVSNKMGRSLTDQLLQISIRSGIINKYDRVTGDSITVIVEKVINSLENTSVDNLYEQVIDFSLLQNTDPDQVAIHINDTNHKKTMTSFLEVVREFRDGL